MAGAGKQTARQQMINLMYLVLTAMLALNVSAEVLNAFKTVNDSLEESTKNVDGSITSTMESFKKAIAKNPEKKNLLENAEKAIGYTEELYKYVQGIKDDIIKEAEGRDPVTGDIIGRDNLDIATRIMLEEKNPQGPVIKSKILDVKAKLEGLLGEKMKNRVSISLDAKDEKDKSWEVKQFSSVPVTAAVTILTKIQADAKNSEAEIIKALYQSVSGDEIIFNQFSANVAAPSSYVLVGQPYEAKVSLAAATSSSDVQVYIGGTKMTTTNGVASYHVTPNSVGEFTWGGKIVITRNGKIEEYPFTQKYQVAAPAAVAMADKMNVLYIGVDNPITVSAAGVSNSKVSASISGGSLTGGNGKYIARVSTPGTVNINISAEVNGKMMNMGSQSYRVKFIPDPIAKFGGVASGKLSAGSARVQPGLQAVLENFDFDARFTVVSYNGYVIKKRQDAIVASNTGASLSGSLKDAVSSVVAGDKIIFDEIKVSDPSGKIRFIKTPVSIQVQ
ncbi:type IX secretion system motor protein PorM/GldM [Solitalea koreensis]|uniref:Gliding motility-associated protein GldM n=1 Tax=Solitalea koreensis TaxID=543615 RepID=A0A521AUC3_9SPHI|nr:gliding motility protein GldM [Solitalea koreensis]SMO38407.1 gliding motility-associated protein GldM [Solitalea koreensis]